MNVTELSKNFLAGLLILGALVAFLYAMVYIPYALDVLHYVVNGWLLIIFVTITGYAARGLWKMFKRDTTGEVTEDD